MTLASTLFACRATRIVVLWLLALVLPLQGAAVGVVTALGPAHVHRLAAAPLVLEDVRRWKPAPVVRANVFAALAHGHVHAGAAPQRHYHDSADTSTVRTDANGPGADEALSASALSVLAPIPAVLTWAPLHVSAAPDAGALWAPRTGFTVPLDRPPRRA